MGIVWTLKAQRASSTTADRALRSLIDLEANASTARVLNLVAVWKSEKFNSDYTDNPFFSNITLNRSIIVKHRLRSNELEYFDDERTSATKVLLPIDLLDMKLGAKSFFVGQKGFSTIMGEVFCGEPLSDKRDMELLDLLDKLPSLDPFLMRERLKKSGFQPARCYFELTEKDQTRMFSFVEAELMPLIGASFGDVSTEKNNRTAVLAKKILENAAEDELDPLRLGMGMSKEQFEEGIFCWKGFIYYKWSLSEIIPNIRPVLSEISNVSPKGPTTSDEKAYIQSTRVKIAKNLLNSCLLAQSTLKVYEDAYADLTANGKPMAFKKFLHDAPSMFYEIGERLGAIQHIISYWRFRFPEGSRIRLNSEEICDLLADFDVSISTGASG